MADNIQVTQGAGTVIATELISGSTIAHHQRIKMVIGAVDVDNGDVSASNPMPVIVSSGTFGTVTITGSTTIASMPSITGSVSVISIVAASVGVTSIVAVSAGVTSLPSITGSVSVINIPAITGSVSVLSMVATSVGVTSIVAVSTSVTNTVTITGSTTLNQIVLPSAGSATVNVTGATTNVIIIPSTATNSIYITDIIISNGLTAGTVVLGQTNVSTAGNIKIQTMYFAANGGCVATLVNPIKLSATTNFVATVNSSGTMSITATYYVAA
jgi:hypothetical protein